ncbi:MAG: PAS domain S-box protein [Geminicoccaceae bacterium]
MDDFTETLLESIGVGLAIIDPSTDNILFSNRLFATWFPKKSNENQTLGQIFNRQDLDNLAAQVTEDQQLNIEIPIKIKRRPITLECQFYRHNHNNQDVVVVECKNISKTKELEYMVESYAKLLETQNRKLNREKILKETILESAQDCIVSIDLHGNIIEWNAAAERTFGYLRDDVLGKPMTDLIIPYHLRQRHMSSFERYCQNKDENILSKRLELSAIRANGDEFPIELTITSQLMGSSRIITGFIRDITDVKESERQLLQAQKIEALGQLTGGVAHDFNNILAVIKLNAEMLVGELADYCPLTQEILRAAARGTEMTERLLTFSREKTLHSTTISLKHLVREMMTLLQRTLGETIEIATEMQPGLWNTLADPGQLESALLNLAINARDAMPNGGKLTITCTNIHLNEKDAAKHPEASAGDFTVLAVTDNGSGMSPEVRNRIFEPFFTTKEVGKGSGLGLPVIHGFVKQSGGHVTIESEDGKGTAAKLYLPRDKVNRTEATASGQTEALMQGNGESILVIEDDAAFRNAVSYLLRTLGYSVISAGDAASAWTALEEAKNIDLVLSDVILPGGTSGPEFFKRVNKKCPKLKAIFMSGYTAGIAEHDEMLDLGSKLLTKPIASQELAQAIHHAVSEE